MRYWAILLMWGSLFGKDANGQVMKSMLSNPYTGLSAMGRFQVDVFSFMHNQAVLPFKRKFLLGMGAEQRYLLDELRLYRMASQFPLYKGVAGIQGYFTKHAGYTEWMCGLAYGMKLSEKIGLGTQFNMYQQSTAGYSALSAYNFNLSLLVCPVGELRTGIQINNVASFFNSDKILLRLPYSYEVAFGYDVSANFFIGGTVIKEEGKPLSVNTGISYLFKNVFQAKFGFVSETASCYGGAGILWNKMKIDFNCSYHPVLGFTPGVQWSTAFND